MHEKNAKVEAFKEKTAGLATGPVAKTLHSQCRAPGFDPWTGNQIPHAANKGSHAKTKDPTCHNEDLVQPNK